MKADVQYNSLASYLVLLCLLAARAIRLPYLAFHRQRQPHNMYSCNIFAVVVSAGTLAAAAAVGQSHS